jgi:hypothetical protein
MSPQEAEMRSSISAWLKCPSEKRRQPPRSGNELQRLPHRQVQS